MGNRYSTNWRHSLNSAACFLEHDRSKPFTGAYRSAHESFMEHAATVETDHKKQKIFRRIKNCFESRYMTERLWLSMAKWPFYMMFWKLAMLLTGRMGMMAINQCLNNILSQKKLNVTTKEGGLLSDCLYWMRKF